jgi:hypothetical protein
MDKKPVAHLQISGDLPWSVISRSTRDAKAITVYGPVPTEEDATALSNELTEMGLAVGRTLTIAITYPVRPVPVTELPVEIDL